MSVEHTILGGLPGFRISGLKARGCTARACCIRISVSSAFGFRMRLYSYINPTLEILTLTSLNRFSE